jgi:hypothetical protein
MGGRRIRTSAAIATLVGLLSAAPALAGPSGEITQAVGNSDTSLGSFAGSATWDGLGCPATTCGWIAVLTVQPASVTPPLYPCSAEYGGDWRYRGDPLVLVAWNSELQITYPGTVTFDGQSFPILSGVEDQRLCLYIGYPGPPFGYTCAEADPYCPPGIPEMYFTPVANAVFTPQASDPGPDPDPGDGDPGDPGTVGGGGGAGSVAPKTVPFTITEQKPTATLAKATAVSRAKAALKRKYGRTYTRSKKRIACKRRSSTQYRCTYTLRYRKKTRRGTVTVRRTSDGVKATVKPR